MDGTMRDATTEDRAAVVALWRACGLTRPWNDPDADFALAMADPASTILIAATPCGGLCASVMVGFDGHRGWVYYLSVDPERQGEGMGRHMMQHAELWLKARGCPKIQLMIRSDNHAAAGFYQRLGYAVQDVMTMGRRLDTGEGAKVSETVSEPGSA